MALVLALVLLAAFVAEPYVARYLYSSGTPRTVEARGDLAQAEKATIDLFQRVSPSVVHVFAQPAGGRGLTDPEEGGGVQTGTGFVWDEAGHIVTNNHVVQGAGGPIAVRLASGETVPASVVGTAPNYDLAVLRLGRTPVPRRPSRLGPRTT